MTAILGAGISGLSAAYYALEHSKIGPLVILEATNRVGGWIRSKQLPDGTIFELGPRTIRTQGRGAQNTLHLLNQLDLAHNIVPIKIGNPTARNKLIYANNKLHLVPNNISALFKKHSLLNQNLLQIIWKDLTTKKELKTEDSVYNFVKRRFGENTADYIISALLCGICAGDARQISVKFLLKTMFESEQKHGSVIKGMIYNIFKQIKQKNEVRKNSPETVTNKVNDELVDRALKEKWLIWALQGGLVQLPLALTDKLNTNGVQILTEHKCEKLRFKPDCVELTVNGDVKKYSRVISSLPAKNLGDLVEEQHPQLAAELKAIPTVTVAVVNLQFPKNALDIDAFGVLVPPKEEIPILGVIFDSCIIPQDSTVLTVMMGGAWYEKYFGKCPTEEHLLNVAINQVQRILHINEDPMAYNVSILKDCIPQHIIGHTERVDRICNYISKQEIPLVLCGSSYQGVGVNDVILSAKEAVSNSLRFLKV